MKTNIELNHKILAEELMISIELILRRNGVFAPDIINQLTNKIEIILEEATLSPVSHNNKLIKIKK